MKKLYRYDDAPRVINRPPGYALSIYRVVRESDCSYWLQQEFNGQMYYASSQKRVSKKAKRPFAHETKEEAAQAYARRKFRHIEHCRRELTLARSRFEAIKRDFGIEMEEPEDEWFTPEALLSWD